jgi:hypothetical protein
LLVCWRSWVLESADYDLSHFCAPLTAFNVVKYVSLTKITDL